MFFGPIIRHALLQASIPVFCLCLLACQNKADRNVPAASAPDADSAAYALLKARHPAFLLNQQGDSAFEAGNYPAAIARYQQSMDSAAAAADSFFYYDSKLDLAAVHDRLDELPQAIALAQTTVDAYIRGGDSARIGRAYTALAGFYGRAGRIDQSLEAGKKGFEILKCYGSPIHRCAAYNQMAFTYSERGRWAEAAPLLDTALMLLRASGVLNQLSSMYLNLGNCQRELRHWAEARNYLQAAAHLADSLGQGHVRAVALKRLSQLEESTGNAAGALEFYRQSVALKDSIFTAEKSRNLQELEVRYQTREKEQALLLLQEKRKTDLLRRDFALFLLAVLLIAAAWQFAQWRKRHRLDQLELEQKAAELHDFAGLLVLKNTRLAALEQALIKAENLNSNPDNSHARAPAEENAGAEDFYNHNIVTDKDWSVFKNYFDKSNPGYRLRLRKAYPDLTDAEERLFLLLKINLSTKEAAAMQGISTESVKKNRHRLRKRLGLGEDERLEAFIRKF